MPFFNKWHDEHGRFSSGPFCGNFTVSIGRACAALKRGFSITGKDGKEYHFNDDLISKYVHGHGRKSGIDLNRLTHLPKAIEAVTKTMPKFHPGDNPPQKTFFEFFEDDRHGMIVFADATTNNIRGFIPSRDTKYLEKIHDKG